MSLLIPDGSALGSPQSIAEFTSGSKTGTKHQAIVICDAAGNERTTFPVTDNAGSLTVDAPVGTPLYARLSDGAAALAGQKTMANSVPVAIASDQSYVPETAPTYAVTGRNLSFNTTTGAGMVALALWHPSTLAKTVRIKRVRFQILSTPATAAIMTFGLSAITSAPTGGTAITPQAMDGGDAASGLTVQSVPTGGAALTGIQTSPHSINAPASIAAGGTSSSAYQVGGNILYQSVPGMKELTMRASVAEGWAIHIIVSTAQTAVTATMSVEFTEV